LIRDLFSRICAPGSKLAWFVPVLAAALMLSPLPASAQTRYVISTVAGTGTSGYSGDGEPATTATFANPTGVAVDSSLSILIVDQVNQVIRKVQSADGVTATVAGDGEQALKGDGGAPASASFFDPIAIAMASNGDYYIADSGNNVIRKISGNAISRFAGSGTAEPGNSGDNGEPGSALLKAPLAVAVDASGNVYIADSNNRVRKVSNNIITTVAGSDETALGDGGLATRARLNVPRGIAVDAAGNIYIADTLNHRIRKVDPATGLISTIAGNGLLGFSGDGGPAALATLNYPQGVAVDAAGNIYIADTGNFRIRRISKAGVITTIAGSGRAGLTGDGGLATGASMKFPSALTLDASGNIYVADTQNNAIRKLTPIPDAPSINGIIGASAFGITTSIAPGGWIEIYGSNLAPNAREWTAADFNGQTAPTSLDGVSVSVGGRAAYVSYIGAHQVNAQAPSDAPLGEQQIKVASPAGASEAFPITIKAAEPGLFAPPGFQIAGKQYVVAQFADGTYVAPSGSLAGLTSRPAKAGDVITIYGVAFGSVSPDVPAGQVTPGENMLRAPVQFFFGGVPASLEYRGLAPGSVGLYQFNIVVPNAASGDAVPLTFQLDGVDGAQTVYTAIQ
jgi:uncharacterized protein (TIGR03437 family)